MGKLIWAVPREGCADANARGLNARCFSRTNLTHFLPRLLSNSLVKAELDSFPYWSSTSVAHNLIILISVARDIDIVCRRRWKMQRIRVNKRATQRRRFETQMGRPGIERGGTRGGERERGEVFADEDAKTRVPAHWQISRATLASDKRSAINLRVTTCIRCQYQFLSAFPPSTGLLIRRNRRSDRR